MAAEKLSPHAFQRRSFVAARLIETGAAFEEVDGAAVAAGFGGGEAAEQAVAERCGLADLSPLPRFGIKGRGAPEWLGAQGVDLPKEPNRAVRQKGGEVVARLSSTEFMVLGDLEGGSLCADLWASWERDRTKDATKARGYPLPRGDSHCWFRLTGARTAAMFAKICAVDLRPHVFANLAIAQTSVARVAAIVIRDDLGAQEDGGGLAYHLLADGASARYLWDCLLDAMTEFDGKPVGLRILRQSTPE